MELLKHPAFSKCDFSNLEFSMSTAMPMAPEYVRLLESIIGEGKFVEAFGLTETLPVIAGPYYGKKKIGSLGLPLPDVEVKVVDPETGEIVPVGEHGELVIKGPQVFSKGYYNMPEETAKILKDGWVYTGDVVRMDEDGYFFIVDRTKDMINVSGYKVFSREMDDLISEHPAVDKPGCV
jgi:long-chain acyl-CoA synthetase